MGSSPACTQSCDWPSNTSCFVEPSLLWDCACLIVLGSSSPGKLPLFALPLYPLLAFYREFNVRSHQRRQVLQCRCLLPCMYCLIAGAQLVGMTCGLLRFGQVAALSSCATTFPLAQQVFTATGTREPLSLSTKLPFIIRAMRFLWGLMPRFVRILFFYFLNASMLPLGSRFRKVRGCLLSICVGIRPTCAEQTSVALRAQQVTGSPASVLMCVRVFLA